MELTEQQKSMLAGESGNALSLAINTLIDYGLTFGAKRLVPIVSAHLAGSFGAFIYKAYYNIIDKLVTEGVTVKVPTTLNPRPGEQLNLLNRYIFRKQKFFDQKMKQLGVTPNYSCVCYEGANVPKKGDILAWSESSAVQYANSVLGARTNRNSVLIDICSAVTGLTPEFGYLLDENRRGRLLVKLDVKKMDASALGYLLGQKVVNRVPVIEHYPFSELELKNMGGAMAASGAVALFHVEGLTPEAPDLKTVFDGEPDETIIIDQKDLDSLRKPIQNPDLVVFGCPQMTLAEAVKLGESFEGKKCKHKTWFCLAPEAFEKFTQTRSYQYAKKAGVEVHQHCPLASLTVRLGTKNVLSNSGKLVYYLDKAHYNNTEECLKICGGRL